MLPHPVFILKNLGIHEKYDNIQLYIAYYLPLIW